MNDEQTKKVEKVAALPLNAGDSEWAADEARATLARYKENLIDDGDRAAWDKLVKDYQDEKLFGPNGQSVFLEYQRFLIEAHPKLQGVK